ncbi:Uncharacterized protein YP598_1573 [Yersinia pseudotuberculosis]|nr:Uncharacterized protein YP598_1573 [Yersinia pseudotuberculosis]
MRRAFIDNDFLSCLCGSELLYIPKFERVNFLSCLCGSERQQC